MSHSNIKDKLKGALPLVGLFMTATGLVSVVYWNYLSYVSANSKEALTIGNENKSEIQVLKSQMSTVVGDTKYLRERFDQQFGKK